MRSNHSDWLWTLVGCLLAVAVSADTVTLASTGASNQRWKDAVDTAYATSFQQSYAYGQAQVVVEYETHADTLVGRLVAANLKPNFAYQIKLEAPYGAACAEGLGSVGRYWGEKWNGEAWANGWNLNSKGDGYYPSPNDIDYLAKKDIPDATSPTGLYYKFSMYVLLAYMITDGNGNGTVDLRMDSSYHVLWRDSQTSPGASDGPVVSRTFTPAASSSAYETDGTEQTVEIFGEWERLPTGGLRMPDGDYDLNVVLTEESFHGRDELDGWWATVMTGRLVFASGLPPEFSTHPQSCLVHSGDAVELSATLAGGGRRGTVVSWRKDGAVLAGQSSLALDLGDVTAAASGTYVCVATNEFGATSSQAAVVLVRDDLWTTAAHDQVVAERDARIADLEGQVADMFTASEVDTAIADARPDRDGDGFTDAQEADRGTDPDLYTLVLKPGWNLISLARVPEDNTLEGILGTARSSIRGEVWDWNPTTMRYEAVDSLEPQRGHWLYWGGEEAEIEIDLPEHPAP